MIELKSVTFSYDAEEAVNCLRNVNLTVENGQVVLLTGASGCGKSTVLRLVNGLIPGYYKGTLSGSVTIDHMSVLDTPLYEMARHTGTVFQNPRSQFFNVDTTSELAFACENMGMPEEEILQRIDETVERFSLQKLMNRNIFCLSGGEKQKIACGSVDVAQPEVILLDEPSANLDTDAVMDLRNLIQIWKAQKKTILIAEHRIAYIWDLIDRAVIMKSGEVIKELEREELDRMTEADVKGFGLRSTVMEDPRGICLSGENPVEKIVLKDFQFEYEKKTPVLNIGEMKLPVGEIVAITGRNGAGKTTFLQCLCGVKKCKGKMYYKGKWYGRKERLGQIFMVMQDVNHQLFSESVLEEVVISMKDEDENRAKEILASLGLSELADRHPMALSGGQKQRVAIACAIASEREILLFDEPTSGLDYEHMMLTGSMLKELKNTGKTVFIVTHDDELMKNCCDRVIHLNPGSGEGRFAPDDNGQSRR